MKAALIRSAVAVMALGVAACGPSHGTAKVAAGKDNAAAQAQMVGAAMGGVSGSGTGAVGAGTYSFNCPAGGNASISASVNTSGFTGGSQTGSAAVTYSVTYNGCTMGRNSTGDITLYGTINIEYTVMTGSGSGNVQMRLNGRVNFYGAYDDFLNADVTYTMNYSNLSSTSGSLSMTFNGFIENSSGRYTYTNESINITAGTLGTASGSGSSDRTPTGG